MVENIENWALEDWIFVIISLSESARYNLKFTLGLQGCFSACSAPVNEMLAVKFVDRNKVCKERKKVCKVLFFVVYYISFVFHCSFLVYP